MEVQRKKKQFTNRFFLQHAPNAYKMLFDMQKKQLDIVGSALVRAQLQMVDPNSEK